MEEVTRTGRRSRQGSREADQEENPMPALEIIERWGRSNGGTTRDIQRQCPELRSRTLSEISEMCERLAAEGRLAVTRIPVPQTRYVGRSLKGSAQYM
jgi:hypothetical protein